MTTHDFTDTEFSQFQLDNRLLTALSRIGFKHCTPIQAESLPIVLDGKNIAGQAQTGTGKTAAYLLATLNKLLVDDNALDLENGNPAAVIISPTRELAIQIHKDAVELSQSTDIRLALVYGGVDYEKQRKTLSDGVDILIGTPGRIIDYFKQGVFNFKNIRVVVLDEADRMFDLGFIKDIRYLLRRMPKPDKRLNMLFSATLSHRVLELAYEHMGNPVLIKINPEQITADKVKQSLYHIANEEKIPLLLGLLKSIDPHRSMIFVNTKRVAEKVWGYLESNGIHSAVLSGDVPQKKRQRLFKEFSEGKIAVLVATDLAARGLHVPDVSHVFNFDLPQNEEDYVHRIGRTARAGASGDAVSFACEEFVYSLTDIEEFIGHPIPTLKLDESLLYDPEPPVKMERKPFNRSRSGKKRNGQHQSGRRRKNT